MIARISLCLLLGAASALGQLAGLLEPVAAPSVEPRTGVNLDRLVKRLQSEAGRRVLDADTLLRELEAVLTDRFGVDGELKLTLVRPWRALELPGEDFALTVTDAPAEGLSSNFVARVRATSGGTPLGEWPLALKAQLIRPMWAATGRIERGQSLDRGALAVQKVDVLRDRQAFIGAEVDPSTLEAVQPITSPRLLVRRDVVARPVVRKGQVVEVVAKRGLLAISMKALALEAGPTGALIRLRNLESQKEFNGQIVDESKVQVVF